MTVQKPMENSQPGRSSSPLAGSRASFAAVPRGSIGPGSIAGTTVSAATTAVSRAGGGAKSGMSGVSGVSGAKSKVSLASAISAGIVLAKDKLAQVRARPAYYAVAMLLCRPLACGHSHHQEITLPCLPCSSRQA